MLISSRFEAEKRSSDRKKIQSKKTPEVDGKAEKHLIILYSPPSLSDSPFGLGV